MCLRHVHVLGYIIFVEHICSVSWSIYMQCVYITRPYVTQLGVYGMDKELHSTNYRGLKLLIHALYTPALDKTLQWRHNRRDGVSNHQSHHFYSNVYSGSNQRKHQSSASLTFVCGEIHRWPVKIFPFPSREISFAHNFFLGFHMVLNTCTEHGNFTVPNDWQQKLMLWTGEIIRDVSLNSFAWYFVLEQLPGEQQVC